MLMIKLIKKQHGNSITGSKEESQSDLKSEAKISQMEKLDVQRDTTAKRAN
jgi:hypothetical protein